MPTRRLLSKAGTESCEDFLYELKRPFDPSAPLFIDFAEHVDHYAGTDRAPVPRDR